MKVLEGKDTIVYFWFRVSMLVLVCGGVVKTRNARISRNMPEYYGISRHFPEYTGTSQYFPMVAMRLFINIIFGRLTTYFITKVMDISHFDGK
jgi:hypothetical protein